MPRYGPFIHQVYIADGFADDCDELVHRCLKEANLDFHGFCNIWKDLKMGCIYEGRSLGAEIAELSEELVHIGKHYMLKDTSNFEESVIGVYIVYALLNLQPYKGFAHIRITPQDLPAINRIEHVARRDKRYDVLYALGSILIKGPVHYHAAEREYGMDLGVRKYLDGFTSIDKLGVRPKGVFRRQNEELDILNDLDTITQKYSQAKMAISAAPFLKKQEGIAVLDFVIDKTQFDRNLKYINANLGRELESSLKKLITGIHEDHYGFIGESSRDDGESIANSRRAIKERAMTESVKPVRHLVNLKKKKRQTVTDTLTSNSPKKKEVKESPKRNTGKLKIIGNLSPPARAIRKRRVPVSPRALKKSRSEHSDGDEDKDLEFKDVKSDTNINEEPSKRPDDDSESIALSDKIKETIIDSKESNVNEISLDALDKVEEDNVSELNIEIDTLPVLIRTEDQGKLFEIEIIDKQETPDEPVVEKQPVKMRKKSKKKKKKNVSVLTKINSMPGMSIRKIDDTNLNTPVATTSHENYLAKIIEIDDKNGNADKNGKDAQGLCLLGSKMEKRDYKRVHIQSKFKRLGMLPVANFVPPEDIVYETANEDIADHLQEILGLEPIED